MRIIGLISSVDIRFAVLSLARTPEQRRTSKLFKSERNGRLRSPIYVLSSPASIADTQTIMMVLTEKMENTDEEKTDTVTVLEYKRGEAILQREREKYCSLVGGVE